MSSIQDRIRRLQSAESDEAPLPPSGTVEAAKARLSRGGSEPKQSVSNIASRFAAPIPDGPKGPSVAAMRERVAAGGKSSSVQARAAKLAAPADDKVGSARVAAARGALDAGRGGSVSNVAGRFEKGPASAPKGGKLAGRASIFEHVAEAEYTAASPRANAGLRPRRTLVEPKAEPAAKNGLSQRAAAFERPAETKGPPKAAAKPPERAPERADPAPKSVLSQRAAAFERAADAKKPERGREPPAKGSLAQRTAAFERSSTVAPPDSGIKSRALQAERDLERSRSASTVKGAASNGVGTNGSSIGKTKAKGAEVTEVKRELADMVAVSKQLLAELATLRRGLRAVEGDRDRLTKRVKELEARAK